jgi:hypothetical protein
VDVGLLAVLTLLFLTVVIMAVGQLGVVVWVSMPMGTVLPLTGRAAMVMSHVVMVMGVRMCVMSVCTGEPFTLSALTASSGPYGPWRRLAHRVYPHRCL